MNPPKKYNPGKEKPPQSVSQGDIVLAKVPNWPWWPVYILSEDQVTQETRSLFGTNATTDQNYRYFQFFHTFEYDFAHMRNMRPFYPEIWRLQLDNNMIKRTDLRAAFRQALDPDDFLANQKVTIEKDFARENKEISEEDFEAYEKKMIEKLEEREAMEEQIFKKALELSIKNEPKTQDVQEYTVSSSSSLSSRRVTAQSDGSIKKETANDQHTSTRRSIRTRKESPQEQQSQLKDDNPHKQAHQLSLSSSSMNQPPPSELSRIDTHSSTEDQLTPQSQHPIVQKPQSTQPSSSIISESNQSPQKQEQSVIPLPVSNSEQGKEQDVTAEVHPLKEQSQNQRQNRDEQISENTQGQIGLDRNSGEGGVKRELEEQEDNQNHQMKKLYQCG
ncbi:hypothetical protein BDA99DRAFT_127835 [Phascolomyces articulosus]|uniref:PWWP domain-containing protein n=1 Tax=Phascolomyces articulosus TaxID=60185 RepID=A0AAD5KB27_9FUNG|nr:hypothetical protein BDA99DRAFT_127835 [Phascolomyces articulosus]